MPRSELKAKIIFDPECFEKLWKKGIFCGKLWMKDSHAIPFLGKSADDGH